MNPKFLNIPEPSAGMIVGSIIGVACLLTIAVLLGFLAKKQWKSFDEYLVGKRDMGPWVTGLALTGSYISGLGLLWKHGGGLQGRVFRHVVWRHLVPGRHHSHRLACRNEDKRVLVQTRSCDNHGNHWTAL